MTCTLEECRYRLSLDLLHPSRVLSTLMRSGLDAGDPLAPA